MQNKLVTGAGAIMFGAVPHWKLQLVLLLVHFSLRADPPAVLTSPAPSVPEDFTVQHGTFAVTILESNQVVVAIDSRVTKNQIGQPDEFQDGSEKVIPLSQQVAFFVTGANSFSTRTDTNSLVATARAVAAGWAGENKPLPLEHVANEFKMRVARDLSRLTAGDVYLLHAVAMKDGGNAVFDAVFTGQDTDAFFKLFRVACRSRASTNENGRGAYLSFDTIEEPRAGRQKLLLLGPAKLLGTGWDDPKSPLAPAIRQIRSSHVFLAEPVGAALVDFGLRQYADQPNAPVGYPIFVYTVDAKGFRMTRKIKRGEPVTFSSQNQGQPPP